MGRVWFPFEIWLRIFEEIVASQSLNEGIGHLAGLCKASADFFESITFKRLKIDESRLSDLEKAIASRPRRLGAIEEILYVIKLPEYDCPDCVTEESPDTIYKNNQAFSSQLRRLFDILSKWDPSGSGIYLRLKVICPSDNRHKFFFCEDEDNYPFRFAEDLQKTPTLLEYHSHLRKPEYICRSETFTYGSHDAAYERVSGQPLQLIPWSRNLPQVPIVKKVMIHKNAHRSIALTSISQILRQSLTSLRSFRYQENLSNRDRTADMIQDIAGGLIPYLPSTLRQLYMTEWREESEGGITYEDQDSRRIAEALVDEGIFENLTEFGASSYVCADCLLNRISVLSLTFENLELISLSPETFKCVGDDATMRTIESAAGAVPYFPKLRVMELWGYCADGCAFIFRYNMDRTTGQPFITWNSSRVDPLKLHSRTIARWAAATAHLSTRTLPLVTYDGPIPEDIDVMKFTQGRAMFKHLELRRLLFHPISLAQLETREVIMERQRRRLLDADLASIVTEPPILFLDDNEREFQE